jgi:hypothetical protein
MSIELDHHLKLALKYFEEGKILLIKILPRPAKNFTKLQRK